MLSKDALKNDLLPVFGDVGGKHAAGEMAQRIGESLYTFVKTGTVYCKISTDGGAVALGVTAGPVTGTADGGVDTNAKGRGLSPAKKDLIKELTGVFSPVSEGAPAKADKMAMAVFRFFTAAQILTEDKTSGPMAAPPPVGPVAGSIGGRGGVDQRTEGMGYDAAKPILIEGLTAIFNDVGGRKETDTMAKRISEEIWKFCKEGIVTTEGNFMAPLS